MEWNEKSPFWDWGEISIARPAIVNGSMCSELGNGSSKSSISASMDSSSKAGEKISSFNFESVEGFHKGLNIKHKELARVEDTGASPAGEPLIGLKLGKRTYFEDVCAGNNTKNSTSSTPIGQSTLVAKKTRVAHQSIPNSHCQVEGCNVDLSGAKDYHRKHRVCESHSKCPKVVVSGQERRFCQQCSRFHDLSEFDQKKRSCRRRLSDHNARRRKPQTDTLSFNSSRFSSPYYDDRQHMTFLLDRAPFGHMRPAASSTWEDSCGFSLTHSTKGSSWIKPTKLGAELQFSNSELSNTVPALPHDLDKLLPFKTTTADVLSQGIEASVVPASNLDRAPDLRRALSLLSTDSLWVPPPNPPSQFANPSLDNPTMQAVNATAGYWQDQPTLPHQPSRVLPFNLHTNASQFQEFPMSRTSNEASFFDSGQILSKSDGHFLEFKT